jgi:hypothetical protein
MSGPGPYDARRWDTNSDAPARLPDLRMIPRTAEFGDEPRTQPTVSEPGDANDDALVRPFLLTGGRTQPVRDGLKTHTLVTAPVSAIHAPLRFELRQIVEICQSPLSVAEIANRIGVPLGVARVLIADLISSGYAFSHEQSEEELSVETIERIMRRVRAL